MRGSAKVKWPAAVAALVVLAGGGTAYAVVGGEDTPTYRTVTARTGDVEQTLTLSGTVDAARRSDLSFGTDGTVARVKVAEGDTVRTGQVVATLDAEDLEAAVTEAEATLAKAKAQLESDQKSQTSSVEQAISKPSGGKAPSGGNQGSTSTATAALLKKVKEQQQAVLTAQSTASAALASAADALAAQTAACADAYQVTTSQSDGATDDPADASASETADTADTVDAVNAACDAALSDVQEKQAAVKDAQGALQDALTELGKTLTAALGSVSGSPSTPAGSSARSTASTASAASGADVPGGDTRSTGSAGGTVTAARLASDQAQIDQAEADLVSARAERSQAVLRSTRSGTVVQLDLAKGDQVSTGDTVAIVVGGKAVTLSGTVSEANVEKVEVGQAARVTVPGSSRTAAGTVTAIGLTADSSTGSTTTGSASYLVTITVEDPTIALPTGSSAQVAIVVATAKDVLTLPVSAISRGGGSAGSGGSGDTASVRVWDGSTLTTARVTLGAVGSRTVAVTDGVEAGTEVVLADVDQEITGASSELDQRGGFSGPPGGGTFTFRGGGGEAGR